MYVDANQMFSDKDADDFADVGFSSDWRRARSKTDSTSQTEEVQVKQGDAQTTYTDEFGVQVRKA